MRLAVVQPLEVMRQPAAQVDHMAAGRLGEELLGQRAKTMRACQHAIDAGPVAQPLPAVVTHGREHARCVRIAYRDRGKHGIAQGARRERNAQCRSNGGQGSVAHGSPG